MNYAAGSNIPGYLPESDVAIFESFEDAKQYLIDELKRSEDSAGMIDDEGAAENFCHAAEDVNLWSGPDSIVVDHMPDSPHSLGLVFWINETDEPVDEDEL